MKESNLIFVQIQHNTEQYLKTVTYICFTQTSGVRWKFLHYDAFTT